jgi:tetratricopeptide (TPR) repeat protein
MPRERKGDKVIRLNPNNAFAYGVCGVAYFMSGQNSRAIQDLERAIALDQKYQGLKDLLDEI